jgi:hypothetical protein
MALIALASASSSTLFPAPPTEDWLLADYMPTYTHTRMLQKSASKEKEQT